MKPFSQKIKLNFFDKSQDFRIRLFHILAFGGIAVSFYGNHQPRHAHVADRRACRFADCFFSGADCFYTEDPQIQACLFTDHYRCFYAHPANDVFHFRRTSERDAVRVPAGGDVYGADVSRDARRSLSPSWRLQNTPLCVLPRIITRHLSVTLKRRRDLVDIIFAFTCVSLICGIVLYFHLKEYDRQRACRSRMKSSSAMTHRARSS